MGQQRKLGISSRREDYIKMDLKLLERERERRGTGVGRATTRQDGKSGVRITAGEKRIFRISKAFIPALRPTRTSIQCVVGIFPGGKAARA